MKANRSGRRQADTLPCNLEAERSVLGAILLHGDVFDRAGDIIEATDFYRTAISAFLRQ
jgi:replicative DNA helicase